MSRVHRQAARFRRTATDRGQTSVEHIGMIAVVVAIIGALITTGVTTELGQTVSGKICQAFGTQCGSAAGEGSTDGSTGGSSDGAAGDGNPGTGNGRVPASTGPTTGPTGEPRTKAERDYEAAVKELEAAEGELSAEEKKTVEAAKKLAKILADELGITDAVSCFTEGDPSSCGETAVNIVLSLIGGLPAKILKKYGWPTEWKKGAKVAKDLVKHGRNVVSGARGMWKASEKVNTLRKKVDDLKKKLPKREKKPEADGGTPAICGRKHSFLPGTPVLLADGTRMPIQAVHVGDLVMATDPVRGETTARPVTATITTPDDERFTRITVRSAGRQQTITATDTHPFWLADQHRWADAGDIRPGAALRAPDGDRLPVVDVHRYTKRQRTHDLTVDVMHTYYVGIGSQYALVHNNDGDFCGPGISVNEKQFGKKWGKHAQDYGLDPADAQSRKWFRERMKEVHSDPDEIRQGPWNPQRGGGDDYLFYKKGNDLVITKANGELVTMFPLSKPNGWHEGAKSVYKRK